MLSNTELLRHSSNDSLIIKLGGRLKGNRKQKMSNFLFKKWSIEIILSSGCLREFLKQCLTKKQNDYFQSGCLSKLVACKKWSL